MEFDNDNQQSQSELAINAPTMQDLSELAESLNEIDAQLNQLENN